MHQYRWHRPRPALAGEVAVVAFLLFGYDRVAALAAARPQAAVAHGRAVLGLERAVGLDVERPLDLLLAAHTHLGQVLSVYYDLAHALVTSAVLAALYITAAPGYRRSRTALLGTNLVALGIFLVLPVAPPRLLPGAGFVDVVARSGTWGSWESASSTAAQHANVYAATPSLHVAWAVWVLLVVLASTRRPLLRSLAGAHAVVTVVIVVVTGNHYLLDVAAGALLSAASWAAASALAPRTAREGRPVPRQRTDSRALPDVAATPGQLLTGEAGRGRRPDGR